MARGVARWAALVLCAAACARGGTAARPRRQTLRVVTYNVRKGTPARAIAADLKPLHADIIALQEVDAGTARSGKEDQPVLLRRALAMKGHYAPSYRVDGGTTGMMILSRFRLADGQSVKLRGSRDIGAVATVYVSGRKLRVYSVHLSATFRASAEHARRAAEAREREAARVMALVATRSEPVLVAGDLNATEGSKPYQAFASRLTDCALKLGRPAAPTYPAALPLLRLDHVFASAPLVPVRARVLKGASDHLLLVVDLAWQEQAPGLDSRDSRR